MELLIVAGMSGAGKSTALHALEDLGDYCVDNMPLPMVPALMEFLGRGDSTYRVAVGVDSRDADHIEHFGDLHQQLTDAGHQVEILFLEAGREVLVRRYAETRRRHPLGELPKAIDAERALLDPVRAMASVTIDSSTLTGRQLRQLIRDRYGAAGVLRVALLSFGFSNGVPSEADVVLDSRFLLNPFDDKGLRPLSGLHEPVAQYVLSQDDAKGLLDRAEDLVRFVVPRSAREGRSYLTIAIGCTGGQHRSVALVEALKRRLDEGAPLGEPSASLVVRHRDIGRT